MTRRDSIRVAVCQIGARRHYAVPVCLEDVGFLGSLVTDFYIKSAAVRRILALAGKVSGVKLLARAEGRWHERLPVGKIYDFPLYAAQYLVRRVLSRESAKSRLWVQAGRKYCELSAGVIPADTTLVYAYTSAAYELFEMASRRGCATLLDHSSVPRAYEERLLREEREMFPGWIDENENQFDLDEYTERQKQEFMIADKVVCGSSYVRSVLMQTWPGHDKKIEVLPLGIALPGIVRKVSRRDDGCLHVLFVGHEGIRKGIGYLYRAVGLMNSNRVDVRVAGNLGLSAYAVRELAGRLNLLGDVPRSEVPGLLEWADVMVLPSISEPFGLVVLEAMARGVPCIVTPNTGGADFIRDGVDGFIVSLRSPEAIAVCLERLLTDITFRKEMSESARIKAGDFDMAAYSTRLEKAVIDAHESRSGTTLSSV